jgi:hypothetical protein
MPASLALRAWSATLLRRELPSAGPHRPTGSLICFRARRKAGVARGRDASSREIWPNLLSRLYRLEITDQRLDSGASPPFDPSGTFVRHRRAITVAPHWHYPVSVRGNACAAIDDFGDLRRREYAMVHSCDLREIGGSGLERPGQSAVTTALDTMARHAGDFILDQAKMVVLGVRSVAREKRQQQADRYRFRMMEQGSSMGSHSDRRWLCGRLALPYRRIAMRRDSKHSIQTKHFARLPGGEIDPLVVRVRHQRRLRLRM